MRAVRVDAMQQKMQDLVHPSCASALGNGEHDIILKQDIEGRERPPPWRLGKRTAREGPSNVARFGIGPTFGFDAPSEVLGVQAAICWLVALFLYCTSRSVYNLLYMYLPYIIYKSQPGH